MPTVTAYRNGSTAGIGGGNPNPKKRDVVKGWTAGAVRRHTSWLYSVDAPQLDGVGYALTLTMRDTPATADDFHAMRKAFMMRVSRLGASRTHWVVEWQRRGTPHLHCAIYFPDDVAAASPGMSLPAQMVFGWLDISEHLGAQKAAQHFDVIDGDLGWLQYLSKHAARGVKHYQRSGHPAGWQRTGRLWGHGGNWPVDAPMKFDMTQPAYWRFRRLVRSWRIADARKSGDSKRIKYARRMLSCGDRRLSEVRGVSDWLPEEISLQLIALLEQDHVIVQRAE